MDKTAENMATYLRGQPDIEAEMCNLIGVLYRAIGEFEKAQKMHERARALQEMTSTDPGDLATTLSDLALVLRARGYNSEAEALQRRVLDMRRQRFGNEHLYVADTLNNLALVLRGQGGQGRLAEAESLHHQALDIQKKQLGNESLPIAVTLNDLALALQDQGKLPEAETNLRGALKIFEKLYGPEHPDMAKPLDNLGSVLRQEVRIEEAGGIRLNGIGSASSVSSREEKLKESEELETKALAMQRKYLGPEHRDVATAMSNLGLTLRERGKLDEAVSLQRRALEMRLKLLDPEHTEIATSCENLAMTLREQAVAGATGFQGNATTGPQEVQATPVGSSSTLHNSSSDPNPVYPVPVKMSKLKEAEDQERRALAMHQKKLGPEHYRIARAYDNLGLILLDQGRSAEAEDDFRKALEMERKTVGDQHPAVCVSFERLMVCLARQGKAGEIEVVANEILTFDMQKTPQGARLLKARDNAREEAGKEKKSQ
jgi:tetratricopeptide (TPR) repeat protein